jgi:16S rRNA (guanine(966)-N(2))-methyltransferase RsmD
MRIISGSRRGLKLETLDGLETRPTTDRVKEALFNLIQFEIMGSKVLDLFAGSGALGIESISRGAAEAIFVDQSRASVKVIERNLERAKFESLARIYSEDWQSALSKMKNSAFDLVFVDPPYHLELEVLVLEKLDLYNLLSEDAIVIIEHPVSRKLPEHVNGYSLLKSRHYGNTALTLYRRLLNDKSDLPG